MSKPHTLRCYQYVNQPYPVVRDALSADVGAILQRATKGAAGRAKDLAATLHVELATIDIGADIVISVLGIEEHAEKVFGQTPTTVIRLAWKAARAAALFPSMEAELSIYALSATETQLDLHGFYRPPFGAVGSALDSLVGHRIADASVHRFVSDIAALLATELAGAK